MFDMNVALWERNLDVVCTEGIIYTAKHIANNIDLFYGINPYVELERKI